MQALIDNSQIFYETIVSPTHANVVATYLSLLTAECESKGYQLTKVSFFTPHMG